MKTVCDYAHLNPARAKLLRPEAPLWSLVWSSWPAYLLAPSKRPLWLRTDRLLGESGIPKDSPAGRRQLEQTLGLRLHSEDGDDFKAVRRGWFFGEESFRKELMMR